MPKDGSVSPTVSLLSGLVEFRSPMLRALTTKRRHGGVETCPLSPLILEVEVDCGCKNCVPLECTFEMGGSTTEQFSHDSMCFFEVR